MQTYSLHCKNEHSRLRFTTKIDIPLQILCSNQSSLLRLRANPFSIVSISLRRRLISYKVENDITRATPLIVTIAVGFDSVSATIVCSSPPCVSIPSRGSSPPPCARTSRWRKHITPIAAWKFRTCNLGLVRAHCCVAQPLLCVLLVLVCCPLDVSWRALQLLARSLIRCWRIGNVQWAADEYKQ